MSIRRRRLSLFFAVLAALFAFARWAQSIQAIPAETIQLSVVHDLTWNPENNTLTRTGNDPYVCVTVPAAAIPMRRVSLIFRGVHVPTEGTFYLFQSPASVREMDWGPIVTAGVHQKPGYFVVSGALQDSKALRVDVPDVLLHPLELRRVVIETPFVRGNSWTLRLATLCAAAALVLGIAAFLPGGRAKHAMEDAAKITPG